MIWASPAPTRGSATRGSRAGRRAAAAARARRTAAARPGRRGGARARAGHRGRRAARGDPAAARADLDAFTDAADAFAGEAFRGRADARRVPRLPDRGRAGGVRPGVRPGGRADSVKLLTVHAAKGLQWPAVFVPGLAAGGAVPGVPGPAPGVHAVDGEPPAAPVRPARGRGGPARAARARRLLPRLFQRGVLGPGPGRGAPAGVRGGHPGRVLAGLFGLLVGRGRVRRLGPSVFLEEVRRSGVAQVSAWAPAPEADAENPPLAAVEAAAWPATPAGRRYEAVREAAAMVVERPPAPVSPLSSRNWMRLRPADQALVAAWDRDAGLLLAERAQRRGDGATRSRCLPGSRCRRW